jgi:hypothetical protein
MSIHGKENEVGVHESAHFAFWSIEGNGIVGRYKFALGTNQGRPIPLIQRRQNRFASCFKAVL